MIPTEQIESFIKASNVSSEVSDLLRELLPGYNELLVTCEKQAAELTTHTSRIEDLEATIAGNELELSKVATVVAPSEVLTKAASSTADVLIDGAILQAGERDNFIGKLVEDPTKFASTISAVLRMTEESESDGFGVGVSDPVIELTKVAGQKLVPLDDPFYKIIYEGA